MGRFAGTEDLHGVFLPPARPEATVQRLGLALAPAPGWLPWVERERLDAVFLHRPWRMDPADRLTLARVGIGVLAYHLAFDEALTTGFNSTLVAACGWGTPTLLGEKNGRPLGMTCALPGPVPCSAVIRGLEAEFGGLDEVTPPAAGPDAIVERVACVGAMNDPLVRAADAAGAALYVTGQWRVPARKAVRDTGIGVAAIGHERSELWGLRALAKLLQAHPTAAGLEVVIFPDVAARAEG